MLSQQWCRGLSSCPFLPVASQRPWQGHSRASALKNKQTHKPPPLCPNGEKPHSPPDLCFSSFGDFSSSLRDKEKSDIGAIFLFRLLEKTCWVLNSIFQSTGDKRSTSKEANNHKKKKRICEKKYVWWWMLTKLTVLITSQYIPISNYYVIRPKQI